MSQFPCPCFPTPSCNPTPTPPPHRTSTDSTQHINSSICLPHVCNSLSASRKIRVKVLRGTACFFRETAISRTCFRTPDSIGSRRSLGNSGQITNSSTRGHHTAGRGGNSRKGVALHCQITRVLRRLSFRSESAMDLCGGSIGQCSKCRVSTDRAIPLLPRKSTMFLTCQAE